MPDHGMESGHVLMSQESLNVIKELLVGLSYQIGNKNETHN